MKDLDKIRLERRKRKAEDFVVFLILLGALVVMVLITLAWYWTQ